MIKLNKDQTLKEFWQQRNGLRLKIQGFQKALKNKAYQNVLTEPESYYIKDINMLIEYLLKAWNGNKGIVDLALKNNKDEEVS